MIYDEPRGKTKEEFLANEFVSLLVLIIIIHEVVCLKMTTNLMRCISQGSSRISNIVIIRRNTRIIIQTPFPSEYENKYDPYKCFELSCNFPFHVVGSPNQILLQHVLCGPCGNQWACEKRGCISSESFSSSLLRRMFLFSTWSVI